MNPDPALFDADQYGRTAPPKPPRPPREPWPTAALAATKSWRGIARTTGGVVHSIAGRNDVGGTVSWCGLIVVRHSIVDGETILACRRCVERGAPR